MANIIHGSTEAKTTTLIDEAASGAIYIGKAKLGSAEDAAVWQIQKLLKTSTVTRIQYANGSDRFNQVWNDRESLTYTD